MRKEIEVKARVTDLNALKANLLTLAVSLSKPVIQHDEIFVDDQYGAFDLFQPGRNILRIRESNGTHLFTLKQPQSNELDCIERETTIADPHEFREALLLMGYKPMVEVHKTRLKGSYKDYEICLDNVKGLGTYIEVEKIAEDGDAGRIQEELFAFLERLGVRREDRETRGYDTLVYMRERS